MSPEIAASQLIKNLERVVTSNPSYDYFVIQRLWDALNTFFRRRAFHELGYSSFEDFRKEIADAIRFLDQDRLIDALEIIGNSYLSEMDSWNTYNDLLRTLPGGIHFYPHHYPDGINRLKGVSQHRKLLGKFFTYSIRPENINLLNDNDLLELNAFGHHSPEAFHDAHFHFYFENAEDEILMRLKYPN